MQYDLLIGLTASQIDLLGVFLACAHAACQNRDASLQADMLKKAFVTYCEATMHVEQLKEEDRSLLSNDLSRLNSQLRSAYAGEI